VNLQPVVNYLKQRATEKQDRANQAAVAGKKDLAELRDEMADLLRTLSIAVEIAARQP